MTMKVLYAVVQVMLDKKSAPVIKVPLWEVLVLEAKHGSDMVKVLDEVEVEVGDVLQPSEEFGRLQLRYGPDEDSKIEPVAEAFGSGARGHRELEREMRKAIVGQVEQEEPEQVEGDGLSDGAGNEGNTGTDGLGSEGVADANAEPPQTDEKPVDDPKHDPVAGASEDF